MANDAEAMRKRAAVRDDDEAAVKLELNVCSSQAHQMAMPTDHLNPSRSKNMPPPSVCIAMPIPGHNLGYLAYSTLAVCETPLPPQLLPHGQGINFRHDHIAPLSSVGDETSLFSSSANSFSFHPSCHPSSSCSSPPSSTAAAATDLFDYATDLFDYHLDFDPSCSVFTSLPPSPPEVGPHPHTRRTTVGGGSILFSESPPLPQAHPLLCTYGAFAAVPAYSLLVALASIITTNEQPVAHHLKQLGSIVHVALIFFTTLTLLGPSYTEALPHKVLALLCLAPVFGGGTRSYTAYFLYTSNDSLQAFVHLVSSIIKAVSGLIAILLLSMRAIHPWTVLRCAMSGHAMMVIVACVYLRVWTDGIAVEYPPYRGSFEGALLSSAVIALAAFCATPANIVLLHGMPGSVSPPHQTRSSLRSITPFLPLAGMH